MAKLQIFTILLVAMLQTAVVKRIPTFAGPYKIILRRVSNVTDDYKSVGDFWMRIRVQSTNPGKVPFGWGRAYNRIPIDDSIRIRLMMHLWNNNEWKKNAFVMNFEHACSDAVYHAPRVLPLFFGDEGKRCPIIPGDRIIPNKSLEMLFPQFPVFPYGRYLMVFVGFLKERVAGIITFEIDTIPKV